MRLFFICLFLCASWLRPAFAIEGNDSDFVIASGSKARFGKIVNGRYYSPNKIFSCKANDFGKGNYISQDVVHDNTVSLGFYNSNGNFQKAEMIILPSDKRTLNNEEIERFFYDLGIGILKKVDDAKGIEIIQKDIIDENKLFFVVSIQSTCYFQSLPLTRGYLAFQEKEKLVLLSNQYVTMPGETHNPKLHINHLKEDLFKFKDTFEFDLTSVPDDNEETSPLSLHEELPWMFYLPEDYVTTYKENDSFAAVVLSHKELDLSEIDSNTQILHPFILGIKIAAPFTSITEFMAENIKAQYPKKFQSRNFTWSDNPGVAFKFCTEKDDCYIAYVSVGHSEDDVVMFVLGYPQKSGKTNKPSSQDLDFWCDFLTRTEAISKEQPERLGRLAG